MSPGSVRPGGFDDRRVGAATAGAAALVAAQVLGKSLRDTLFLGAFGVRWIPYAMIGAAILSGILVLTLARATVRRSPRAIATASLVASAGLLMGAWAIADASPRAAAVLTYVQAGAVSAASVSVFWTLVSDSFDPFTGRAVVPRIMAGATLGGLLGGTSAWAAASHVTPHDLLPLGAALNLAAIAALSRVRAEPGRATVGPAPTWRPPAPEVRYLRAVGLVVLLAASTQALLDYVLTATAAKWLAEEHELLAFFALFQTGVGVVSFLVQIGVSRSLLERFGPGFVLAAPPSLLLLSTGLAFVVPPLALATMMRGVDGALGASLHRSAYEVLFAPLDARTKRVAKPLLDVGLDRSGMLLGSACVAGVAALAGAGAWKVLLAIVAVLAASRAALSAVVQKGYRRVLADALAGGRLEFSHTGFIDRATLLSLSRGMTESARAALFAQGEKLRGGEDGGLPAASAALSMAGFDLPPGPVLDEVAYDRRGDDSVVEHLLTLRSGEERTARAILRQRRTEPLLVPQVLQLLGTDGLARDAADWLSSQEPAPIGLLADAVLDWRLPDATRRRAARILGKIDDERAREALLFAVERVPVRVRFGIADALARAASQRDLPRERVLAALKHVVREAYAEGDSDGVQEIFSLLAAAFPHEPVDAAFRALRRGGRARGTALEWLDVLLPHDIKNALWPRLVGTGEETRGGTRDPGALRRALLETDQGEGAKR